MTERDRMLDTIVEMNKWSAIKDKRIETLEKAVQWLLDYGDGDLLSWVVGVSRFDYVIEQVEKELGDDNETNN